MSRWHSYLNTSQDILSHYKGDEPFAIFVKRYFSQQKKIGGTDRKWISHLCYCFFRMGKSFSELPTDEKILAGLWFCSNEQNEMLAQLRPAWNEITRIGIREKFEIVDQTNRGHKSDITNVFPWQTALSNGLDHEKFCESFFTQPELFLRIRPGMQQKVLNKLVSAGIPVKSIGEYGVELSNAAKIDGLIDLDKEAVVQDLNSQRVGEFIQEFSDRYKSEMTAVWDCCAASGGKSIMAVDILPGIRLTVSDNRETIIQNLKKRFIRAGIKDYSSFVEDLTTENKINPPGSPFSLIIADVPCTGSGTWGRTPEQLYFFEKQKIDHYTSLQRQIISGVSEHVEPGGYLLYITCSVFSDENEKMADYIREQNKFQPVSMKLLTGYEKKADSLFAALFQREL